MIFTGLSCLIAMACVGASVRRLAQAVALTSLDPGLLLHALRDNTAVSVCAGLRADGRAGDDFAWERDLLVAFAAEEGRVRDALVNEQLSELDGRAQRGASVPRVCASVATSAGFFLASVALVEGLSVSDDADGPLGARSAVMTAVNAVAIGLAGTSFCYAVHLRVRRLVRERLSAVDRLILRMESVASQAGGAP